MSEQKVTVRGTAWWAQFTLIGGILAAVLLILGPIGYRLGVVGVEGAVLLLPGMATALAVVVLGFALVGGLLVARRGLTAERGPLLAGGLLALAIVVNMGLQFAKSAAVPPIHDVTTAPEDPPAFEAVVDRRGPNANPLAYDADALAEVTRTAYPEVRPLETSLAPAAAFDRALATARALGWEIVAEDRDAGRIEATDTTALYGFADDVVIRIRPTGDGSRVDLRSVSRVGVSDLGANAARILAFLERFRAA